MTADISIFDPDKSDRAERLYAVLRPFLTPKASVVDIGCGQACLLSYISKDFPEISYTGIDHWKAVIDNNKKLYPQYTWLARKVVTGHEMDTIIDFTPDVVIHIGIDSWKWTTIWKVHEATFTKTKIPQAVLLETGYNPEYPWPYESYEWIRQACFDAGFVEAVSGNFDFDVDNHHLKERRYSVLIRVIRTDQ